MAFFLIELSVLCGITFALFGIKFPWFNRHSKDKKKHTEGQGAFREREETKQDIKPPVELPPISKTAGYFSRFRRRKPIDESTWNLKPFHGSNIRKSSSLQELPKGTVDQGVFRQRQEAEQDLLPPISEDAIRIPAWNLSRFPRRIKKRSSIQNLIRPTSIPPSPPIPPREESSPNLKLEMWTPQTNEKIHNISEEEISRPRNKIKRSHLKTVERPCISPRRGEYHSKDEKKHTEGQGVFRKRQEAEQDIKPPVELPPTSEDTIRIPAEDLSRTRRRNRIRNLVPPPRTLPRPPIPFPQGAVNIPVKSLFGPNDSVEDKVKAVNAVIAEAIDELFAMMVDSNYNSRDFQDDGEYYIALKERETMANSANEQGKSNSSITIKPEKINDPNIEDVIVKLRQISIYLADEQGKRNNCEKYEENFENLNDMASGKQAFAPGMDQKKDITLIEKQKYLSFVPYAWDLEEDGVPIVIKGYEVE